MIEKEVISIRPHHALCSLFFEGKGYNGQFVVHMSRVLAELDRADAAVALTDGCDVICEGCPNRKDVICATEEKVRGIDTRTMEATGMRTGETFAWSHLRRAVLDSIVSEGSLRDICGDCEWIEICAARAEGR